MKLRIYIIICLLMLIVPCISSFAADDDLLSTDSKTSTGLIDGPGQDLGRPNPSQVHTGAPVPAAQAATVSTKADDSPVQVIEPKNPIVAEAPRPIATDTNIISATENPDTYIPFNGIDTATMHIGFKSLFYTPEQTDLIYNKMKKYRNVNGASPLADTLSNGADSVAEGAQQKVYEHKMYYLSSVLYPNDKNWTIWVNKQKIRKEDSSTDPEIAVVEPNYVTFVFRAGQELINYSPEYQTKLVKKDIDEPDQEYDLRSADGNIQVSSLNGDVRFKLRQNQTFSLFDLTTSEGYVEAPAAAEGTAAATSASGVIPPVTAPVSQVDQATKDINLLKPINGTNPANNPILNNAGVKVMLPTTSEPGFSTQPAVVTPTVVMPNNSK